MNFALKVFSIWMLAVISVCSFAATTVQTVWDAEAIARSNSELSVLYDKQKRPAYTVNVSRLKRVLETLDRLQAAAGTRARLWLIQSEDNAPNAFAYIKDGASQIVITTSVLDFLGDDLDAYAFLIGHEIGHIVKEHGSQRQLLAEMMRFSREISPTEFSGRFGREIKDEASVSAILYGAAFDRDQERQADSLGLKYMMSGGFDPRGALRLHKAIMSSSRSERPAFLSTHPSDEERLSNIENVIRASVKPVQRGWAGIARTNAVESDMSVFSPGDEGLARIAEAMAIIKREYIFPVDDRRLIAGCLYRLAPTNLTSGPNGELSLKDIAEAISPARRLGRTSREQTNACLDGMVGALDRRSVRVDADEVRILQSSARMAGIGVALEIQDEMPSVVSVVGGGPAEHAGLKRSDLLTHIDGVPTHGLPITQVFGRLRGAAGSPVAITIERPGAAQVIQIQPARAFIKLRSVDAHLLPSGYGHIRIRYFGPKTLDLLGHALRSMEENSATRLRGIVLDLRSNPGGELSSCVGTASAFLPENLLVVETEGRTNDSKLRLVSSPSHYVPKGSVDPLANLPPRMKTLPMAVLVNNDTASGSEIVAAALQDYKRALIIGYRTNGSGAITNLFPLRNNDVLKLNIGLYNRPNGDITADIGVIPDFTLPSTIRETTTSNDFQLDETVKILSETLSR